MSFWPDALRFAVTGLGLAPDAFWRLTPSEWRALTCPGDAPMTRARLDDLLRLYPDEPPCPTE